MSMLVLTKLSCRGYEQQSKDEVINTITCTVSKFMLTSAKDSAPAAARAQDRDEGLKEA
jgi:hypothetical protein